MDKQTQIVKLLTELIDDPQIIKSIEKEDGYRTIAVEITRNYIGDPVQVEFRVFPGSPFNISFYGKTFDEVLSKIVNFDPMAETKKQIAELELKLQQLKNNQNEKSNPES